MINQINSSNLFNYFSNTISSLKNNISNIFNNGLSGFSNNSLVSPDKLFLSNNFSNTGIQNNFQFNNSGVLSSKIVGGSKFLALERLKRLNPEELKNLGKNNKMEFFKALLPAALETERIYGVPAAVTLAQAALESGWAKSPIGGFNIFGIKGSGPAGTVQNVKTGEYYNGKYVKITDNFARYNNFYEAILQHGRLFRPDSPHRKYREGVQIYKQTGDANKFIDTVASTYATSPTYSTSIKNLMKTYDLVNLSRNTYFY